MANLGIPQVMINFKTQASTAIIRSARGSCAEIINDESVSELTYFKVLEAADIPAGTSAKTADLIEKGLMGAPKEIHVYLIPPAETEIESEVEITRIIDTTTTITSDVTISETESETVESEITIETTTVITETVVSTVTVAASVTAADALREIADTKINWISYPTGGAQGQQMLGSWVKSQRANRHKTFKAVVANYKADDEGVVNLTTGNIKVVNPAYTDALDAALGDANLIPAEIPQYVTYTAAEYTARIMGILAGMSLATSSTYTLLPEVVSCAKYDDIDAAIDAGELCLFDEKDGNGVKIARGINSLTSYTSIKSQDLRWIKTIEALDLIADDISTNFRENYIGKINNSYTNKMLLISSIHSYFAGLMGTVLDNSPSAENYVEIDTDAHKNYAAVHGLDVSNYSQQQLLELNTGTQVFLRGRVTPLNSMEDLTINFVL